MTHDIGFTVDAVRVSFQPPDDMPDDNEDLLLDAVADLKGVTEVNSFFGGYKWNVTIEPEQEESSIIDPEQLERIEKEILVLVKQFS